MNKCPSCSTLCLSTLQVWQPGGKQRQRAIKVVEAVVGWRKFGITTKLANAANNKTQIHNRWNEGVLFFYVTNTRQTQWQISYLENGDPRIADVVKADGSHVGVGAIGATHVVEHVPVDTVAAVGSCCCRDWPVCSWCLQMVRRRQWTDLPTLTVRRNITAAQPPVVGFGWTDKRVTSCG